MIFGLAAYKIASMNEARPSIDFMPKVSVAEQLCKNFNVQHQRTWLAVFGLIPDRDPVLQFFYLRRLDFRPQIPTGSELSELAPLAAQIGDELSHITPVSWSYKDESPAANNNFTRVYVYNAGLTQR